MSFTTKPPRDFSFVFFDVGQGEGALIQSQGGKIIMIDCGGNIYDENIFRNAYEPFFRKYNIKSIETIIISHPHPDHTKALKGLLETVHIKEIYAGQDFLYASQNNLKIPIKTIKERLFFKIDDIEIDIIPPPFLDKKINNNSLWTVVSKGKKKVIFTGDTEVKFIDDMLRAIKIEKDEEIILKVPHHGSRSSFSEKMYKKIRPKYAVISVGQDNIWNLPSWEVLSFLRKENIRVLRTDIQGQINIK